MQDDERRLPCAPSLRHRQLRGNGQAVASRIVEEAGRAHLGRLDPGPLRRDLLDLLLVAVEEVVAARVAIGIGGDESDRTARVEIGGLQRVHRIGQRRIDACLKRVQLRIEPVGAFPVRVVVDPEQPGAIAGKNEAAFDVEALHREHGLRVDACRLRIEAMDGGVVVAGMGAHVQLAHGVEGQRANGAQDFVAPDFQQHPPRLLRVVTVVQTRVAVDLRQRDPGDDIAVEDPVDRVARPAERHQRRLAVARVDPVHIAREPPLCLHRGHEDEDVGRPLAVFENAAVKTAAHGQLPPAFRQAASLDERAKAGPVGIDDEQAAGRLIAAAAAAVDERKQQACRVDPAEPGDVGVAKVGDDRGLARRHVDDRRVEPAADVTNTGDAAAAGREPQPADDGRLEEVGDGDVVLRPGRRQRRPGRQQGAGGADASPTARERARLQKNL